MRSLHTSLFCPKCCICQISFLQKIIYCMQTDFISLNACPSANYSQIGKYLEKAKSMIPAIHIEIIL